MLMDTIRLTQFSHGAGCGCKLSPAVLHEILSGVDRSEVFENLIIGNDTKDDAAVVDLGDGTGIISTTDFFMPIVDDPRTFGRIAAANAISDIYAMEEPRPRPLPSSGGRCAIPKAQPAPWWMADVPRVQRRHSVGRRTQHRQPGHLWIGCHEAFHSQTSRLSPVVADRLYLTKPLGGQRPRFGYRRRRT